MDIMSELAGGRPVSLTRYAEFLRHILSSSEFSTEEEWIKIMDFREVRGLEPDYLYFCGLKDGDMPSKPPVDHILPDSVRTEYGLIRLKEYLALQKLDFLRVTGTSPNLHLSYPSVDGDKVFLQSPYLPWAGEVAEKTFGIFSEEELQVRGGKKLLSDSIDEIHLDGKTRDRLLKKDLSMPLRVTDIDYFRRCPRRFFMERVLDLEASEIAEYKVEARMLGTVIHSIMEELLKGPIEEEETLRRRASAIIDSAVSGYAIDPYWKMLIKESFLEILPRITDLEAEFRGEGYFPRELEAKVTEEVLPGIVLKGKIDRIDSDDSRCRIIDYKTGAAAIGSEIIKKGKDLQIPLYAAMLRAKGMDVERAGIYSLGEIGMKWIPTKRDKNTLEDYIAAALKFLQKTVDEIREGRFEARPMEEFFCSNCSEAPFCPYIQAKGEIR
jgi:ATP-dependent helicase/DNAse subunit B